MSTDKIASALSEANTREYVTVKISGQLFGLPIEKVQDVFMPDAITEVPLALPEVAGVLNLRGRIVTAIDMRKRLSLPPNENVTAQMAVGLEFNGESYGLIIDEVGEVLKLDQTNFETNPSNLDPRWTMISNGVQRLDGQLMVILDVNRLLATDDVNQAA
ncbi:MAG: chemotaxis protein CheW [Methyloligellaceae bacterium]